MTRLVAAVATLILLLVGCSALDSDDTPTPVPISGVDTLAGVPKALLPYYTQQLAWRECRGSYQCADLTVPLDYGRPKGKTISLSVVRVPASGGSPIGSLVVNPGGPGGSAIEYATGGSSYWGAALRSAYDIVGVDPRGVGESTPVQCQTDSQLDALLAFDPDPETPAELATSDELTENFFAGCMKHNPGLAIHISTAEGARDMDVLRAALDHPKLTFFGASYGTLLGATYADLFPDRVGRLVLDGAIDPTATTVEESLVQAEGFETALRAYVANCVDTGGCFLGVSVDDGVGRIAALLDQLDAAPLPTDGDRDLTEGLAFYGIIAPLYNRGYWPILDSALQNGFSGSGTQLLALSDAYTRRGPIGYTDNAIEALSVVSCLDRDDPVPESQIPRLVPEFQDASPTFGTIFASGLSRCAAWSYRSGNLPAPLIAEGSDPILVIGTTRDPATPLRWAEALADQLDNAALIRRDGDGHTGYRAGNECVDDAVEAYLLSGQVPDDPTDC